MSTGRLASSHVIHEAMTTCPGIPGPRLGSHLGFEESHGAYAAGATFTAVPPRIAGLATFPIRTFAPVLSA